MKKTEFASLVVALDSKLCSQIILGTRSGRDRGHDERRGEVLRRQIHTHPHHTHLWMISPTRARCTPSGFTATIKAREMAYKTRQEFHWRRTMRRRRKSRVSTLTLVYRIRIIISSRVKEKVEPFKSGHTPTPARKTSSRISTRDCV